MSTDTEDPYLWLEEIASPDVREWLAARNAETLKALGDARFEADRKTALALLDADDRIPHISRRGRYVYNYWQDASHPKGLWRRTSLAEYRKSQPAWDVLLDLDALAAQETEDWVWHGCTALPPTWRRGLVQLSRGGADASVLREFDLDAKRFIDDGFTLPEAKTGAAWMDEDRLLVATPLGGDQFATESGYARTVRLWRRGTPFTEAPIVFECERTHIYAGASQALDAPRPRTLFVRALDFINSEMFVEEEPGNRRRIDVPTDASASLVRDWLIVTLRTDWTVDGRHFPAGALLVIRFDAFMAGGRDFTVLFAPSERAFLQSGDMAGGVIAFKVLDDVRSRVTLARNDGQTRQRAPLEGFSAEAVVDVGGMDQDFSDAFLPPEEAGQFQIYVNNAITPLTVSLIRFGEKPEPLKSAPARFDARGLAITQHHAEAADGTRIPYFQVARADLKRDGTAPTLLTGYGGFQVSVLPYYAGIMGKLWLERGGVEVIANIRGGGEFGPAWHDAGRRAGKKVAHDDFAAVARDLVARGVTRRERLAPSSARCRCSTCGATPSCRPGRAGSPNTAIPTSRRTGRSCRRSTPITWRQRGAPIRRSCSPPRRATTASIRGMRARWRRSSWRSAPRFISTSRPKAAMRARPTMRMSPTTRRWRMPFCATRSRPRWGEVLLSAGAIAGEVSTVFALL
jgi:prolyl oligopeptidase